MQPHGVGKLVFLEKFLGKCKSLGRQNQYITVQTGPMTSYCLWTYKTLLCCSSGSATILHKEKFQHLFLSFPIISSLYKSANLLFPDRLRGEQNLDSRAGTEPRLEDALLLAMYLWGKRSVVSAELTFLSVCVYETVSVFGDGTIWRSRQKVPSAHSWNTQRWTWLDLCSVYRTHVMSRTCQKHCFSFCDRGRWMFLGSFQSANVHRSTCRILSDFHT